MEVVTLLNEMYTKFDKYLEKHDVYKVETIGDAYMIVSGLPECNPNHANDIIEMAFDMLNTIVSLINPATGKPMEIRIGCHSGAVVAGYLL
jgi:class 3 adenylate cyclase